MLEVVVFFAALSPSSHESDDVSCEFNAFSDSFSFAAFFLTAFDFVSLFSVFSSSELLSSESSELDESNRKQKLTVRRRNTKQSTFHNNNPF